MASPFYMTVVGTTQGNIEGYTPEKGHEKQIQCHALEQSIQLPFDRMTGAPQGRRFHGPIKINKSFDKSSPKLYQALATGEELKEVKLDFYRITPAGMEEKYFSITMSGAIIVEMKPHMLNHYDPELARYSHMEDISFTYKRIEWRHEVDGVSAADNLTT